MTSDHKLRAEVADLRLQLEQRTRSEEKALEERTRLERMLQDSQRFLVEDEVKLEQYKQQAEKREAELSDARQTLVAREATVQQLAQEVLQLRRELAEEREQKRKLQFKEASLRRAALAKPLGAATELLLQERAEELEESNGLLLKAQATLQSANDQLAEQAVERGAQLQRLSQQAGCADALLSPCLAQMQRLQREQREAAQLNAQLARANGDEARLRGQLAMLCLAAHRGLVAMHEQLAKLGTKEGGAQGGPEHAAGAAEAVSLVQVVSQTAEVTRRTLQEMQALRPFASPRSPPLLEQLSLLAELAASRATAPPAAAAAPRAEPPAALFGLLGSCSAFAPAAAAQPAVARHAAAAVRQVRPGTPPTSRAAARAGALPLRPIPKCRSVQPASGPLGATSPRSARYF